jgi:hypothetical protein
MNGIIEETADASPAQPGRLGLQVEHLAQESAPCSSR